MTARTFTRASTLFVTMMALAALSALAAYTLLRVMPKFRMAYQTAAWQEARLAAEAGVDAAMGDLIANAAGAAPGAWNGWRQQSQGGLLGPALSGTLEQVNGVLTSLLGGVRETQPIFLDNLRVTASSGVPTEVDVQLWALHATGGAPRRWFRIRAMATCGLPATAYPAPLGMDAPLRRLSLRNVRPQLRRNDVGTPSSIPAPSASRTIEVLVEPILPWEMALWTRESLSLGSSGTWGVDSYDSRDGAKSDADGIYPGWTSPKAQANGHVASNLSRPADSPYGPLISANGAQVRGVVASNGGDNPDTPQHENVAGSLALDLERVRDDFFREMPPVKRPAGGLALPLLLLRDGFVAGTEAAPLLYVVPGKLGAFRVTAPPAGVKGAIIILVNGDLDVEHGGIEIPPTVTAQLYVRGNIDFHNNGINTGALSSNRPGRLQIFGEGLDSDRRTLRAYGPAAVCAAFYGPGYEVNLQGNVQWCGAIAAKSFAMLGGGSGGFHYDEALAVLGPPVSFRIVRYVEDVRE